MRLVIVCITLFASIPLFSQSKKELIAEVNSLKAQIAELKKPKEADTSDVHQKASYGLGCYHWFELKNARRRFI